MATLLPKVANGDWNAVRRNFQKIGFELGPVSTPTFGSLTLTSSLTVPSIIVSGLSASRLTGTNASKALVSVSDFTAYVAGTANRVTVADDGDGSITLSTPQDIHVDATPEWAGTVIKDSGDIIVFYVDDDEFYVTAVSGDPVTGNPIGLLLVLTYTV